MLTLSALVGIHGNPALAALVFLTTATQTDAESLRRPTAQSEFQPPEAARCGFAVTS